MSCRRVSPKTTEARASYSCSRATSANHPVRTYRSASTRTGLVTQDQGTAYGCVREVALSDIVLAVSLDPASLDDLELEDAEIEALLLAPEKDIERLRKVLVQVLAFGRTDARPRRVDL